MKEPDSKCKSKTKIKRKYRDVFLVFTVLMITGVLLAVSAFAQPDQLQGAPGQEDLFASDNPGGDAQNLPPTITSLESKKQSPQEAGSSIKWTAKAKDPEDDPLSFMFRLNGPSTGFVWKPVTSWSGENTWDWETNSEDAGDYQISVLVRDETHIGPQFTPDEKIIGFTLTAPPAPQEAQAQPTVEPLPIVPIPEQTYVPPVEEQQTYQTQPVALPGSTSA